MDIEKVREHCLNKPGTTEDMPFGEDVLAFRVMNKIFALLPLKTGESINLKCDPALAISLREEYSEVQPGFHMNKKNWNTVELKGNLTSKQILEMIDHSYELVNNSLSKKQKII